MEEMMRQDRNIDERKNVRLGLILGGVSLLMFLLMFVWAWQYVSLLPS
jgi:hypothetical protein